MRIAINQPQAIHELGQRANQEDNIWPLMGNATQKDFFFILCDGMGGHEHGEVASRIVSQTLAEYIQEHINPDTVVEDQQLLDAIEAAYQALDRADSQAVKKMGTTLCLLIFHRGGLTALHIGDSRIYHVRPSAYSLLFQSKDHSLVYDLYQAGEIAFEEMATSPQKNIITRAMQPGEDNRCKPSIVHITDLLPGDYFYMCSDGMLEQMDNDTVCRLFSSEMSDEEKRSRLIEATKDNRDNHSAYFLSISSVTKEAGDDRLFDDEQTSKDNALNIVPPDVYDAEEVKVVAPEPEQIGRPLPGGAPNHIFLPEKKDNRKALIGLAVGLGLLLLAAAYLLLVPSKETKGGSENPMVEKLEDIPAETEAGSRESTNPRTVEITKTTEKRVEKTTIRTKGKEDNPKADEAEKKTNPDSKVGNPKVSPEQNVGGSQEVAPQKGSGNASIGGFTKEEKRVVEQNQRHGNDATSKKKPKDNSKANGVPL